MNMLRKSVALLAVIGMTVAFSGCGEKSTAEKAGDAVEKGVEKVQQGTSDAAKEGSKALDNLSKDVKK